eukprot:COSAG02_NODE_83_length_39665_cov_25.213719_27_plen_208_part_00
MMPDPGISADFRMLDDDTTALHVASMYGSFNAARVLLQNGAAIELRDACGRTALHHAASENQEQLMRLLIQSGADRDTKDCQGLTPAQVCCNCTSTMLLIFECVLAPMGMRRCSSNSGLITDSLNISHSNSIMLLKIVILCVVYDPLYFRPLMWQYLRAIKSGGSVEMHDLLRPSKAAAHSAIPGALCKIARNDEGSGISRWSRGLS